MCFFIVCNGRKRSTDWLRQKEPEELEEERKRKLQGDIWVQLRALSYTWKPVLESLYCLNAAALLKLGSPLTEEAREDYFLEEALPNDGRTVAQEMVRLLKAMQGDIAFEGYEAVWDRESIVAKGAERLFRHLGREYVPLVMVFDAYGEFWKKRSPLEYDDPNKPWWDDDIPPGAGRLSMGHREQPSSAFSVLAYCGAALSYTRLNSGYRFDELPPLSRTEGEWSCFLEKVAFRRTPPPPLLSTLFQSDRHATSELLYEFLRGNPGETFDLLHYLERNAERLIESSAEPHNLDTLRLRCEDWMLERVYNLRRRVWYLRERLPELQPSLTFEHFLEQLALTMDQVPKPGVYYPQPDYINSLAPRELIYCTAEGMYRCSSWPAEQVLWELFQADEAQRKPHTELRFCSISL